MRRRLAADLSCTGPARKSCQASIAKICRFSEVRICRIDCPSRLEHKGRIAIVTKREAECGGREGADRRAALFADGEVVWSRRPDAGVKSRAGSKGVRRGDGGKQALAHQGEREVSRKPLRREGRLIPACTCGSRAFAQVSCAGAPGAAATRPSLRPRLCGEGDERGTTRADSVARGWSHVSTSWMSQEGRQRDCS